MEDKTITDLIMHDLHENIISGTLDNIMQFPGDEWLKLNSKHAIYIYEMHDKIKELQGLLEMLHERAKIEVVNYKYEGECEMVENILNPKQQTLMRK